MSEEEDKLAQLKSPIKKLEGSELMRSRYNRLYRHRKMSFPAVSPSSNSRLGPLGLAHFQSQFAHHGQSPLVGGVGVGNLPLASSIGGNSNINNNNLNLKEQHHHHGFHEQLHGHHGSPGRELIHDLEIANRRYRRFSNVSDAVSRKLSTTIGWRTVSVQDIVSQTKMLCGQFIRMRLKKNGISNKRLGLQRLRSVLSLSASVGSLSAQTISDIFNQLHVIGAEMERLHPNLYTGIFRQVRQFRPKQSRTPVDNLTLDFQVAVTITNEKSVSSVLSSISRHLLKADITWAKIVSLYCVAGGLAVDSVQQGHPEYLFGIVETMGLVIERDAANWIAQQGGWVYASPKPQLITIL